MKIYILFSDWMLNGNNSVNEVKGVYDCLKKAQHALIDSINVDLQAYPYNNIWADCTGNILDYDIPSLANMNYDDKDFCFDATIARLWNDNENCSENYITYFIDEYEVL